MIARLLKGTALYGADKFFFFEIVFTCAAGIAKLLESGANVSTFLRDE